MQHTEFNLEASDGTRLYVRNFEPTVSKKGVVCLIHGLGDHSGLYLHVAEYLKDNGYAVMTVDLRGHGCSGGKRGHIDSLDQVLDDIYLLTKKASETYPILPLFLYGHSLGGNFVLNYTLRRKSLIKGAISTSPWLRLAFEPSWDKLLLARFADRLFPSIIQNNTLCPDDLSHDQLIAKAYTSDPLVHSSISARLFTVACGSGVWAAEHAASLEIPVLLMHGSGDRITSFDASRKFAENAGDKCTFRAWDGLYHELHNEYQKQEVMKTILDWLDSLIKDLPQDL